MTRINKHKHTDNYISLSEAKHFFLASLSTTTTISTFTLKRISNWPPSICYLLGNIFGEKYK